MRFFQRDIGDVIAEITEQMAALAKGKKGALVGAAIGGGGAAVWDQITRRK